MLTLPKPSRPRRGSLASPARWQRRFPVRVRGCPAGPCARAPRAAPRPLGRASAPPYLSESSAAGVAGSAGGPEPGPGGGGRERRARGERQGEGWGGWHGARGGSGAVGSPGAWGRARPSRRRCEMGGGSPGRGAGARAGGRGAPSSGRRGAPACGTGLGAGRGAGREARRPGSRGPGARIRGSVLSPRLTNQSGPAEPGGTATVSAALAAPRPAPRRQLPAASSRRGPRVSGWVAVIRLRARAAEGGGGGAWRRRPRGAPPGPPPPPPAAVPRPLRAPFAPRARSLSLALAVGSVRLCRSPSVSLHLPVSAAFLCLLSSLGLSLGPRLSCSLRLFFSLDPGGACLSYPSLLGRSHHLLPLLFLPISPHSPPLSPFAKEDSLSLPLSLLGRAAREWSLSHFSAETSDKSLPPCWRFLISKTR